MFSDNKRIKGIQLVLLILSLTYVLFPIVSRDYTIAQSIDSGLEFIKGSQQPDGSFVDYDTDTGTRRSYFPTFFVPWNLIPVSVLTGTDMSFLNKSIQWILDKRNNDGLWGFQAIDAKYTSDPDDSSYAIFSLLYFGEDVEEIIGKISEFQTQEGGFRTWHDYYGLGYGESPLIQDLLISSVAAYTLWSFDKNRYEEEVGKAAEFVSSNQDEEGYWTAFWYYGKYQPTYYAIRILQRVGGYDKELDSAKKFILQTQNPDGGWGDPSNSFETAHSVLSLMITGGSDTAIEKGIGFLLDKQDNRGAWESWPQYAFIPLTPTGSEVSTTSVVVKALACYEKFREGYWHMVLRYC